MKPYNQLETPPRPFLKWAGGKSQLLEQYKPYLPGDFKSYYEPFLGGAAVFFFLSSQRIISASLTDINAELINAYCCVRDKVEQAIDILQQHQEQHCKDYYYQVRSRNYDTDIERAARLIYLNKTCFNGLYRENSHGGFNVPIGRYKNPNICNAALLRSVSVALKSAKIEVRHFEEVLKYASSHEDFVYFDPPYYPISSTSYFTGYSRYSFKEDDQIKLRDIFAELASRGVKVMLSNSDCTFVRELYNEFNIHTILASRSINSAAKKRGKIAEVLVTSY
jgi:DNA adenine methylase